MLLPKFHRRDFEDWGIIEKFLLLAPTSLLCLLQLLFSLLKISLFNNNRVAKIDLENLPFR
jgi:hypothetical protein